MTRAYQARALHDGVKPGFRAVVDNPHGWPIAHCMTLVDAEQIAAALNTTPSQRLDAATVERCITAIQAQHDRYHINSAADGYRAGCRHAIDVIRALATEPHQHGGKGA